MTRLERSVAGLVRQGHAEAWRYPWGVFASAVEEAVAAAKA